MGRDAILANPNVQLLIKTFDLTADHSLNACEYRLEDGKIIIEKIEIINIKGNHERFVDLAKVAPFLKNYPITFIKTKQENEKKN